MEDINNNLVSDITAPAGIPSSGQPNPIQPASGQAMAIPTPAWKAVVTIISLILLPLLGIILTWVLTNWSKTTKIILTFVPVLYFILSIVFALGFMTFRGLDDAREKAQDAQVKNNLSMMSNYFEMYYDQMAEKNSGVGSYPIGNSFREAKYKLIETGNYPQPSGSQSFTSESFKYCSSTGQSFKLSVALKADPAPFIISSDNASDTCTPGE